MFDILEKEVITQLDTLTIDLNLGKLNNSDFTIYMCGCSGSCSGGCQGSCSGDCPGGCSGSCSGGCSWVKGGLGHD